VEYKIDEDNRTATLIKRIRRFPDAFGVFMGNAQRLENGNTICGWGNDLNGMTEFDPDGNMLLDIKIPDLNYRAFKFDWRQTIFSADRDTIDFGDISPDTISSENIMLKNHTDSQITINRIVSHQSPFTHHIKLPFTLLPGSDTLIDITFQPDTIGEFFNVFTFCSESDTGEYRQRIASQVYLKGSYNKQEQKPESNSIKIYPNPVSSELVISSSAIIKNISIYSTEGSEMYRFDNVNRRSYSIEGVVLEILTSGIYIIRIVDEDGMVVTKKIILI